ncbi:MAG: PCMD domain-containing protein [Bacteroidales bacterium]|nr:PCMD domain-containing protein [Bacteroidales bacterium]
MNRFKIYSLLLTGLLAAASCRPSELDGDIQKKGYLTVSLSQDLKDIIEVKSDSEESDTEEIIYRLDVYDSDGNLDFTTDDHTSVSEEEPIELLMGKYDVVASHGQAGTGFNVPCYSGTNQVRIYAEKSSSVDILCKMSKVKVSVNFPQDAEFAKMFPLCEFSLSNGETLTFSTTPDAEDPKVGSVQDTAYFEVPKNKELTYNLKLKNADGVNYSITDKLERVSEAEHYHFDFKIGEREDITGALVVNVSLNGEFQEGIEHKINLNFDKTFMPSFTTNTEFDPTPDGTVPVYPLGNDILKKFTFSAPRGIRSLVISHLDVNLLAEGLPQLTDFVGITADELKIMTDIGIKAQAVNVGAQTAEIDITDFIKNLSITPENETYLMSLTVIDSLERYARCDFEFTIVSDIQAETVSATPWSSFATLKGRYFSKVAPAGMTFQYKKTSDSEWTEIDKSLMVVDETTMTYSYLLNHLDLNTDYVFRSTSDKDKADGKTATEIGFKTYSSEGTVYNLSFDDWTKVGKAWYATDDSNDVETGLIWDSANEGTSDILGQSLVPTTPEETIVIEGKAARMESGELLSNFAAGNIYTGDFGSATISPVGAKLKWGVPFTSRPLALRGWYRYEPVAINRTSSAYSHLSGQTDFCQIQIFLTNWTVQFEISTGDNRFVDTSMDNPEIIAYGGIISQDNTTDNDGNSNGYIQFTIPLEYRSLEQPTYIVISGAASRYGDYFTGGLGSTLYLDELELIYDPEKLTPAEFELVMKGIQ